MFKNRGQNKDLTGTSGATGEVFITDKKKPFFFSTIMFQITAINLIMLVAFVIVMNFVMKAMDENTQTSKTMSESVLELSTGTADLKADVTALYDQVIGYASTTAPETREALSPEIQQARAKVEEDMASLKEGFADQEDAMNALSDISVIYQRLSGQLDQAIAYADSGETEKAYNMLFQRAEIQKVAISHSSKTLDQAITRAADLANETMDQKSLEGRNAAMQGTILFIILIVINYLFSYFGIVRKIKRMAREVRDMIGRIEAGEGDLTARVTTGTRSEIVYLKNGINGFIETLQKVMRDVKNGAGSLARSEQHVNDSIEKANGNIQSTSAAMEEMSASMQTVSATITSINGEVEKVRSLSNDISEEVNSGKERTLSIHEEAGQILESVTAKKSGAILKMETLSSVLDQAVRDSEQVQQIEQLTDVILGIAQKTNILAINASIEAARAGQAGKSFAVVAKEVGDLAAGTSKTANDIQEISRGVMLAVKNLASNAREVMDFMGSEVMNDYDAFVETGEKYENTANVMNDMLMSFNAKTGTLSRSVGEMADSIEDISSSIRESSSAIRMTADNTMEIVAEMDAITGAMNENSRVTANLNQAAQKFAQV